jgi:medium-chain acyl-[acyl-carrier-protein] hydrolase
MCAERADWMVTFKSRSSPSIRLICCPYAGGSPELFRNWQDGLDEGVELLALRLPGRGSRIRESLYRDWEPLLKDVFAALLPYLAEPHAFYGHSFGGRLLYNLAQLTTVKQPGATRRLFLSGCRSPNIPQRRPYLHEMPDEDFRNALRDMRSMPEEILASKAIMRSVLPVIRSEIRLAEIWGDPGSVGIDIPITAIVGSEDHIDDRDSMRDWQQYGGEGSEVIEVPGDHFFLKTHQQVLIDIINARLGTIQ